MCQWCVNKDTQERVYTLVRESRAWTSIYNTGSALLGRHSSRDGGHITHRCRRLAESRKTPCWWKSRCTQVEENTAIKEACIWYAAAWLVLRAADGTGWPQLLGQERAGDVRYSHSYGTGDMRVQGVDRVVTEAACSSRGQNIRGRTSPRTKWKWATVIVTELVNMNLPEDLPGLTIKKELNRCKWILKIKTILEWFKVVSFTETSIWHADKEIKTIRKIPNYYILKLSHYLEKSSIPFLVKSSKKNFSRELDLCFSKKKKKVPSEHQMFPCFYVSCFLWLLFLFLAFAVIFLDLFGAYKKCTPLQNAAYNYYSRPGSP